jgi:hypothetical protein
MMSNNTKYFVLLAALILTLAIASCSDKEEPVVVEPVQQPITVQPSDVEICAALVSDTLNETYLLDNEYSAVSIWNKLKKNNFECTLVFGNLSMSDEPITSCDRLWVTFQGIAIDSGAVYIDDQHFEGYAIDSPNTYQELKDAIDDYLEYKARYIADVETYNTLLNQAAKDNMEKSKSEYLAANERLITEIS